MVDPMNHSSREDIEIDKLINRDSGIIMDYSSPSPTEQLIPNHMTRGSVQSEEESDRSSSTNIEERSLMPSGQRCPWSRRNSGTPASFFLEEVDGEETEEEDPPREEDSVIEDSHMLFHDSGTYVEHDGSVDDDDTLTSGSTQVVINKSLTRPIDIPAAMTSGRPRARILSADQSPGLDSVALGSSPYDNLMMSRHRSDSCGRMFEQGLRASAHVIAHRKHAELKRTRTTSDSLIALSDRAILPDYRDRSQSAPSIHNPRHIQKFVGKRLSQIGDNFSQTYIHRL